MNLRILSIVSIFISITLNPFASQAQTTTPVATEFLGAWIFDSAETQERPADSQQSYVIRNVSQDEFWQKSYLLNVPTQIVFMGDFMVHISHPSWSRPAVAVMNNGLLEFRNFQETPEDYNKLPELSKIHSYPTITSSFSLTSNGNLMSLQSNYTYSDTQGKRIEGILTVYYKR